VSSRRRTVGIGVRFVQVMNLNGPSGPSLLTILRQV